jgi:hypothetical protein
LVNAAFEPDLISARLHLGRKFANANRIKKRRFGSFDHG